MSDLLETMIEQTVPEDRLELIALLLSLAVGAVVGTFIILNLLFLFT